MFTLLEYTKSIHNSFSTYFSCSVVLADNGLFHFISIHPLWMSLNEWEEGIFRACPGESTLILMKGSLGARAVGNYDYVQGWKHH